MPALIMKIGSKMDTIANKLHDSGETEKAEAINEANQLYVCELVIFHSKGQAH